MGCSLVFDRARAKHFIFYPEGVLELDEPATAIITRCDGRSVAEVVESLSSDYEGVTSSSVMRLLDHLIAQRVVADGGRPVSPRVVGGPVEAPPGAPIGLIAEVTHRCPLQCVYCSNPIALEPRELPTESWLSVLDQAVDLGVRQLHLTGGEPLLRRDLTTLVDGPTTTACTRTSSPAGSACRPRACPPWSTAACATSSSPCRTATPDRLNGSPVCASPGRRI